MSISKIKIKIVKNQALFLCSMFLLSACGHAGDKVSIENMALADHYQSLPRMKVKPDGMYEGEIKTLCTEPENPACGTYKLIMYFSPEGKLLIEIKDKKEIIDAKLRYDILGSVVRTRLSNKISKIAPGGKIPFTLKGNVLHIHNADFEPISLKKKKFSITEKESKKQEISLPTDQENPALEKTK